MTRVWAVQVSRSTADWASRGSVVMVSHSAGSRLEVTMVAACLVAFDDEFVEVGGLGGVQGPEGEVVDDEQVDVGQPAHFGFEGVVEPGGSSRLNSLSARDIMHGERGGGSRCARARWRGGSCRRRPGPGSGRRGRPSRNRRVVRSASRCRS